MVGGLKLVCKRAEKERKLEMITGQRVNIKASYTLRGQMIECCD